jgi:hypothetical protein
MADGRLVGNLDTAGLQWKMSRHLYSKWPCIVNRTSRCPYGRISSGSSQRRECPDVDGAEAPLPGLVHLLREQQPARGEPMRSGQLVPRRQLSAELLACDGPLALEQ